VRHSFHIYNTFLFYLLNLDTSHPASCDKPQVLQKKAPDGLCGSTPRVGTILNSSKMKKKMYITRDRYSPLVHLWSRKPTKDEAAGKWNSEWPMPEFITYGDEYEIVSWAWDEPCECEVTWEKDKRLLKVENIVVKDRLPF